jgi:hypothetical protein
MYVAADAIVAPDTSCKYRFTGRIVAAAKTSASTDFQVSPGLTFELAGIPLGLGSFMATPPFQQAF